jgi:hypothetical protein
MVLSVCVCVYVKTHTYGHTHTHNESGMEQARMKALKQGYGTGFELCFLCVRVFVHVCTSACMYVYVIACVRIRASGRGSLCCCPQ